MLAGNDMNLKNAAGKLAPTQLRVANAIEWLSFCAEDRNAAKICFWHKIRAWKIGSVRILLICDRAFRGRGDGSGAVWGPSFLFDES